MINTIENIAYNNKERMALECECDKLEKEYKERNDRVFEIEDEDTFQEEMKKLDEWKTANLDIARLRCFAAQFPKRKNAWFENAVAGFAANGTEHTISPRQYECFSRYASCTDRDTWRNNAMYCRVGTKLVELHPHCMKVYQL